MLVNVVSDLTFKYRCSISALSQRVPFSNNSHWCDIFRESNWVALTIEYVGMLMDHANN